MSADDPAGRPAAARARPAAGPPRDPADDLPERPYFPAAVQAEIDSLVEDYRFLRSYERLKELRGWKGDPADQVYAGFLAERRWRLIRDLGPGLRDWADPIHLLWREEAGRRQGSRARGAEYLPEGARGAPDARQGGARGAPDALPDGARPGGAPSGGEAGRGAAPASGRARLPRCPAPGSGSAAAGPGLWERIARFLAGGGGGGPGPAPPPVPAVPQAPLPRAGPPA
ncbi:MAG: hypothetical protein LBG06_11920, partial [Deltaproteobacteria bacterium]|nr:hypothetical protein [Deltaproteobacteria bacterium]